MAEGALSATLLRLMSWLSPAFPIGAFAYSHGLEQAIHEGLIRDRETLIDWLGHLIERGSGWNDAVLLAEAWRVESFGDDCAEIAELAEALAGSKERHMETTLQGAAFAEAAAGWGLLRHPANRLGPPSVLPDISPSTGEIERRPRFRQSSKLLICTLEAEMSGRTEGAVENADEAASYSYPVTLGITAARHAIPLPDTLIAFLHAFASNLIQAAVRLVPLGQRDGVAALAALEEKILATAARAENSTLDDLGSCTVMSDIMSMRHEVLYSRVFRS